MEYGKGIKSRVTAKEVLKAAGAGKKYFGLIGRGLNIGGLNITDEDQSFTIPEGTETLEILAPETDPITLELTFDSSDEIEEGEFLSEEEVKEEEEKEAKKQAKIKEDSESEDTTDQE